ncbi:MAG: M1 family aminopeptidase [Pyrinomonadaceae bacterium]
MKKYRPGERAVLRLIKPGVYPAWGKSFWFVLALLLVPIPEICAQSHDSIPPEKRLKYQINLKLDFEARTYSGNELVHWINRGDHATSVLYFHLYSNLRSDLSKPPAPPNGEVSHGPLQQSDEPRLDVIAVKAAGTGAPLPFLLDDQGTTLRINLGETVAPGNSTDVEISFKGAVPEIDPEETGLVTHIVQQVSAALRSDRELRRARDINFRCRNVLMLGTPYPVLAARNGDEWLRKVEPSVGDTLLADVADYAVEIEAAPGLELFTSGELLDRTPAGDELKRTSQLFAGENLRDFAIVAGPTLRSEKRTIGNVTVRTVYLPEHERVARNVLGVAAQSLQIFSARFGHLPLKDVTIVGTPLVAGLGSAEFSGLGAIASAFYVDFDSPAMRNMPEVIREQRESLEESLEWTVAHMVAHQWWGAAVGSDPARQPVLDEALANWSALLYYKEAHGEELAASAMEEQLRGVYKVYRTFGGEDLEADRVARDYRNSFQYTAIVAGKAALMFVTLQRLMGDEKYFAALKSYYAANAFEIADLDDLRGAFIAEAPLAQRRTVARTFGRWLSSKRGDEDVAPPDAHLAAELGLPAKQGQKGGGPLTAFARVGKFFWQQMTRIR